MAEMELVVVWAFDDAACDTLILSAILGIVCSHASIAYQVRVCIGHLAIASIAGRGHDIAHHTRVFLACLGIVVYAFGAYVAVAFARFFGPPFSAPYAQETGRWRRRLRHFCVCVCVCLGCRLGEKVAFDKILRTCHE